MATVTTNTIKKYKDLDLNFTVHPIKKDINKHVDHLAVINSIKNLILLNHFEKPFHPEIGSNVRKLLFENFDIITSNVLQREIENTITNFEPRVIVNDVTVGAIADNNQVDVSITFTIRNIAEPITIRFFLSRER